MMRYVVLLSMVSALACGVSEASETWGAIYGSLSVDRATALARTPAGGYMIAGQTRAIDPTSVDALLLNLGSTGTVAWARACGRQSALSVAEEGFTAIACAQDGTLLAAGWTSAPLSGPTAALVASVDEDGNPLWQRTYGNGTGRATVATSACVFEDGCLLVAGLTYVDPNGDRDLLVLRADSQGDVVWDLALGGSGYDAGRAVKSTSDRGCIVLGHTESDGAGGSDAWVLKFDEGGALQWQYAYGGSQTDDANAILETSDGGYLVAGWSESFGAGHSDAWVVRLDSEGAILWQRTYGGENEDRIWDALEAADGAFVLVGETELLGRHEHDVWILKIDSEGQIICQTAYDAGGFDRARAVAQTDTGFVVLAETNAYDLNGDLWLLSLDATGHLINSTWSPQPTCAYETSGAARRTDIQNEERPLMLVASASSMTCREVPVFVGWGHVDASADEPVFAVPYPSYDLHALPDENWVAVATSTNVEIRKFGTWELIRTLSGHKGNVGAVAFSSDGTALATASDVVFLWDAARGDLLETLSGHKGWIKSLAFSADGAYLASGSADLSARVWLASNGSAETVLLGHRGYVEAVAWSPSGVFLASGALDGRVLVWDPESGKLLHRLAGHQGWVRCVAVHPGGRLIASGSADRTVKLWDAQAGVCVNTLTGLLDEAWSIAFSANGRYLAAGAERGPVVIWDVDTGTRVASLGYPGGPMTSVQFFGSAACLIGVTEWGKVFVWDVGSLLP